PALDGRDQVRLALVVVGDLRPPAWWRRQAPGERVGDATALLLDEDLLEGAQPAAAELGRDVGGGQAELDRPSLQPVRDVLGELAVVRLGVLLVLDQLVGETACPGLQLEVVRRESVHTVPLRRWSSPCPVVEPVPGGRARARWSSPCPLVEP